MASRNRSSPSNREATADSSDPETALETARRRLDRAAAGLDVDDAALERLRHPAAVHEVTVP